MRWLAIGLLALGSSLGAQSPTCVTVLVVLDTIAYPKQPATRVTVPCPIVAPVHDTVFKTDTLHRVDTVYVTKPDTTTPPIPPPSTLPSPVTLPLVWLSTIAPPAPDVGGIIIRVAQGGNLQAALDAANPGDVVELAAGSVFTGNFVFKNKGASTKWITIRPSNYLSLPPEGQRMTPTIAATLGLPRIETPNTLNAIGFSAGANHIRIAGIEVSIKSATPLTYALVNTESASGQKSLSEVPNNIVLDRVYVHGSATQTVRRCVALNSAYSAVIDSYLSDCHEMGSDSQAIAIWNGPGPFKIVNNYLEAAGENIMIGGTDPSISGLTPSDIEIRHNHLYKPIAWKGLWTVKNLLETKNAQRVLIEGNRFENSWTSGQNGLGIGFKSSNQSGSCTWCVTQDVTYRLNVLVNVGAAYNIGASPDNAYPTIHARRIAITDNLADSINTSTAFNGDGRMFYLDGDLREITIARNTTLNGSHAFVMGGAPAVSIAVSNNLFGSRTYALIGTGLSGGAAWAKFAPTGILTNNYWLAYPSLSTANFGSLAGWPATNFFQSGYLIALPGYPTNLTSAIPGAGADLGAIAKLQSGVVVP